MTATRPSGYCFYPVSTGHLDGTVRTCCRSAKSLFGALPVCTQHLEAMLAQLRQAIWDSPAVADQARSALDVVDRRGRTTAA